MPHRLGEANAGRVGEPAFRPGGYPARVRIGILTREYPPDVYGGAGVHVDFLVRELVQLARDHVFPACVQNPLDDDRTELRVVEPAVGVHHLADGARRDGTGAVRCPLIRPSGTFSRREKAVIRIFKWPVSLNAGIPECRYP